MKFFYKDYDLYEFQTYLLYLVQYSKNENLTYEDKEFIYNSLSSICKIWNNFDWHKIEREYEFKNHHYNFRTDLLNYKELVININDISKKYIGDFE